MKDMVKAVLKLCVLFFVEAAPVIFISVIVALLLDEILVRLRIMRIKWILHQ